MRDGLAQKLVLAGTVAMASVALGICMDDQVFHNGMTAIGPIIAILTYVLAKEFVSWARSLRNRRSKKTLIDITSKRERWRNAIRALFRRV